MNNNLGKLIIARHHESEWNKLGVWTGMRDRHLTEYGFHKSTEMGLLLKDVEIDRAFASMKVRAIETLSCMLESLNKFKVPTIHSSALDERDYGDYTGKNKWEMQKLVGEEKWEEIRRGWDCIIPKGETLKMVYDRVIPFFLETILPMIRSGNNVIVVAHGNSLRALIKYIERISDEGICNVDMPFGAVVIYSLDENGFMLKKEVRIIESKVNA